MSNPTYNLVVPYLMILRDLCLYVQMHYRITAKLITNIVYIMAMCICRLHHCTKHKIYYI